MVSLSPRVVFIEIPNAGSTNTPYPRLSSASRYRQQVPVTVWHNLELPGDHFPVHFLTPECAPGGTAQARGRFRRTGPLHAYLAEAQTGFLRVPLAEAPNDTHCTYCTGIDPRICCSAVFHRSLVRQK
jgi:hypothetical protein